MGRRTKQEIADDIRQQESQLAHVSGFTKAGVDPAYVADRESFNGYRHQQIWDLVHQQLDPNALGQIASAWGDRAQKLHDLFDTFHQDVQRELSSWSGTFATTAQQSAQSFVTAAAESHDSALTVQRLMDLNSSAAQTVKAAIPPPPAPYTPNPDPAKEAADSGRALRAYQDKAAAAEAEAQDTCNHIYNPTLPASGDSVPRFVPAPASPSNQAPAAPGVTTTNVRDHTLAASTESNSGEDNKPGDSKPGDQPSGDGTQLNTGSDHTEPASTNSSTATSPSSMLSPSSGGGGTDNSTQTTPSAVASPSAALGSSIGTGPNLGVSGEASEPERGEASQIPGKSVPGQPLSPIAQAASAVRPTQSTSSATSSPSSGMPHAGHGKESKDDAENTHSSPEYLRRQYEELSDLPSAPSGLIGPTPDMYDEDSHAAGPPEPTPYPPVKPTTVTGTGPLVTGKGPLGDDEQPAPPPVTESKIVTGKGPLGDGE